jgi:hypothetical protein
MGIVMRSAMAAAMGPEPSLAGAKWVGPFSAEQRDSIRGVLGYRVCPLYVLFDVVACRRAHGLSLPEAFTADHELAVTRTTWRNFMHDPPRACS